MWDFFFQALLHSFTLTFGFFFFLIFHVMELNKAVSFVPTLKSKRRIHDPTCENPECNSRKLLVPTFDNRQNLGTVIMCCYLRL